MSFKSFLLLHPFWIDKYDIGGLYDPTSNIVLSINKNEYNLIVESKANPNNISEEASNLFRSYSEHYMLQENNDRDCLSTDFVSDLVQYSETRAIPRKLTLELTENCNLRCRYCRYTINEAKQEGRYHNSIKLPYKKAVVAIDNYLNTYRRIVSYLPEQMHSQFMERNPAVVGFYGGEALLEIKTLKKLIKYCVNKAKIQNIPCLKLFVTTNGTLLSSDIICFFVDYNVYMAVSLDGPQCENDKNRVFKRGKGTFVKIYKSLKYIQENYPEYYKSYVTIQAVAAPNYDTVKVNDFFLSISENNLYAGVRSFIRLEFADFSVDQIHDVNANIIEDGYIDEILEKCILLCESIGKNTREEDIIKMLIFNPEYMDIFRMAFNAENRIGYLPSQPKRSFNSCYIGKANMVLRANGEYHLCERTDYSIPIGNVDEGLVENEIQRLYQEYFAAMNRQECRECWAAIFCPMCVGQLIKDAKIQAPTNTVCKQIRYRNDLYLKLLLILAHEFPHVYNALQRYLTKSNDSTIDEFLKYYFQK